ncbi:MAG: acyl-ACP--UDP-N-acetylglucosamine O-acyltransferase [Nitrospirae bacterium]|nr:acyl-ACP--UDP-N-acetylglucosamine O-acyltransferase [Nitrospirota bacterium]
MNKIHNTAIIDPKAELAEDVTVGPYSIIGPHVRIGRGTVIDSHALIDRWTEIGSECRISSFTSIGTPPQDISYAGEETRIVIGDRNTIREYATIHRGTKKGGGITTVGSDNYIMSYVHIAHDCRIGNHIVMANAATLGGHVRVEDYAVIGGLTGVHQFVRIGAYSMVGACSAVSLDVPPYVSAVGNRAELFGLNIVGLRRHGFDKTRVQKIKKAYNTLFRSKHQLKDALINVLDEIPDSDDVKQMVIFIKETKRGICR